ncbi:hypothetical protein LTR56_013004 [Elasticomyces elasticus]|nr:hypothetical protein LTR56_013004 [Elasticomyces elasticus]KAK3649288.1 hypothetical protein LTR22_013017 [Elasticomyces elasticus]KAK4928178.1 hypothetical protein LTR49_005116 [Elasticomyces elasticus]KAK5765931.1 hypothetical protein LTS12_003938 [Elasticomyces elasticus]
MKLFVIVFPLLLAGAYGAPLPPPDDDTSDAGRHELHPTFGPPPPNGDTTDDAVQGLNDPAPLPPTKNDTSDAATHGLNYAGSLSQPGDDIMMPPPLDFVAPLAQRNYDTTDAAVHGLAHVASLSQPNDDISDAGRHGLGFAAPLPLPINDDGPAAATLGPMIPGYGRDISLATSVSATLDPLDPVNDWHGHFGGGDGEGRAYPPSDPIDGDDWRGHISSGNPDCREYPGGGIGGCAGK